MSALQLDPDIGIRIGADIPAEGSPTESRSSNRKLKPLPPDPFRHQNLAIARTRSGGLSDNVSSRLGANRNRKTFQMSRGHGHIERLVLSSLGVFKQADVQTIAYRAGVRHGSVSVALRSSINRALRNLCREGLVREAGKYGSMKEWTLTAKHRKEQKKRQARERA